MKDAVDPNMILIDPSPLLNTEMENIRQEFKKLLKSVKENVLELPHEEEEEEEEDVDVDGTEIWVFCDSLLKHNANVHHRLRTDRRW